MMIHWITAYVVMAVISVLLGLLVGGLPHKHPDGILKYFVSDAFGLPAALTFVVLVGMISIGLGFGRVYVVKDASNVSVNYSLGNPDYLFGDGQTASIQPHCVVNDTGQTLVLETVVYGTGEFKEDIFIKPNSAEQIDSGTIHYFFDNKPPNEIKSKGGYAIHRWLRYENK